MSAPEHDEVVLVRRRTSRRVAHQGAEVAAPALERAWIIEMQHTRDARRLLGVFTSEAKLDAFAVDYDPAVKLDADYVRRDDDFIPFFRKRSSVTNCVLEDIDVDGTPIYSAKHHVKKAEWQAARAAPH